MTVCIVDDVLQNAQYAARVLEGYDTVVFTDPHKALAYLKEHTIDVLLTDQKMPGLTGTELVEAVQEYQQDFLALVVSAYTDPDDLVEAVNSNLVHKYLVKPVPPGVLHQHVLRACERLELMRDNERMRRDLQIQNTLLTEENRLLKAGIQPIFDVFTGSDPAMNRVKELTQLFSVGRQPILISGETGTGKELLARVVHTLSDRKGKPFLPLNCAAIQEGLLESELFGHEAGAFTGATKAKKGLFELADGGILFLDEIGELPLALQAKLLRVVQFGSFLPVGATRERTVDVRIVSATNKNLRMEAEGGRFRADLFHRISAYQIHLPPLRKRKRDIMPILERIAEARSVRLPDLTEDAQARLIAYDYPGNVRELQNVLDRLAAFATHDSGGPLEEGMVEMAIDPEMEHGTWSNDLTDTRSDELGLLTVADGSRFQLADRVSALQRHVIIEVFEQEEGNISRTASRIGMSRPGLRAKLREYGLVPTGSGDESSPGS